MITTGVDEVQALGAVMDGVKRPEPRQVCIRRWLVAAKLGQDQRQDPCTGGEAVRPQEPGPQPRSQAVRAQVHGQRAAQQQRAKARRVRMIVAEISSETPKCRASVRRSPCGSCHFSACGKSASRQAIDSPTLSWVPRAASVASTPPRTRRPTGRKRHPAQRDRC